MIRRAANRLRRFGIEHFARRDFRLNGNTPYVSFTFDDFPQTALTQGGHILLRHHVRGTYFISFQLMNCDSPSGRIASFTDLQTLLKDGHELGCHTFGHLDGSAVTAGEFERSIDANREALNASGLNVQFETFAYPLNGPAVATKRLAGSRFRGCRGGGQRFNYDTIDLSHLKAYFLDRRNRPQMDDIAHLIEQNAAANGWLIFATHDVADRPSEYGCSAPDFDTVVRLAIESGARVMPMIEVCRELGVAGRPFASSSAARPASSSR